MATDWKALLDAASGGAITETTHKLEDFETATKVILVASVIGAITGSIGLVVALSRR